MQIIIDLKINVHTLSYVLNTPTCIVHVYTPMACTIHDNCVNGCSYNIMCHFLTKMTSKPGVLQQRWKQVKNSRDK